MSQSGLTAPHSSGRERLLYIDNLRILLIVLVVTGHLAITYGAPTGSWYFKEGTKMGAIGSILTSVLLGIGAAFMMGLFFMIAAYFTAQSYERKGGGGFVLDKLLHLGIPLLVFVLIINPLVIYMDRLAGGFRGSIWEFIAAYPEDVTNNAPGPLWFVEFLLIFSILYALWMVLFPPKPASLRRVFPTYPSNFAMFLFASILSVATFIVRLAWPVGWTWEPPHLEPAHTPQYMGMFAAGILAYRGKWFQNFPNQNARAWGWVSLVFILLMFPLAYAAGAMSGELDTRGAGGFNWLSLAYSTWESFLCVAMSITTLHWFRERVNRQNRLGQAMSGAAYATYILHPLVIVPLAIALSPIKIDISLKFLLVAPLGVALSFLVGYTIRQLPMVRRVL